MIREVPTSHPFNRGRCFRDDDKALQALVSDELAATGTYQHVSVSGRGRKPTEGEALTFVEALREMKVVDDEERVEMAAPLNKFVRHYVPVRVSDIRRGPSPTDAE